MEATEVKASNGFKDYLDKRSDAAKNKILAYIQEMVNPSTVSGIARATGTAKPTVIKTITRSMQEGNPYKITISKVGKYEVIFKAR